MNWLAELAIFTFGLDCEVHISTSSQYNSQMGVPLHLFFIYIFFSSIFFLLHQFMDKVIKPAVQKVHFIFIWFQCCQLYLIIPFFNKVVSSPEIPQVLLFEIVSGWQWPEGSGTGLCRTEFNPVNINLSPYGISDPLVGCLWSIVSNLSCSGKRMLDRFKKIIYFIII